MITTCLWSPDNTALEMAEYYTSIFPDSKINHIGRYDAPNEHVPGSKAGDVMIVEFEILGGQKFSTLNGGPYFKHSCAVSFMIPCEDATKLEYYYDKLSSVAEAEQCGWICDRFGVSWQLVPDNFIEYMKNGVPEKKKKVMQALLSMRRISWSALDEAYSS